MASAAIPMLIGTGISLIGSKAGWDPRLTALASMAGGGIAGGAMSGAFGSVAGSTATSVNPHAGFGIADIAPTRFPFGMSATPHVGMGVLNDARGTLPYPTGTTPLIYDGPSGFDIGDGQAIGRIGKPANQFLPPERSGAPTYMQGQSGFSKWITGPKGKALGADMLKTFLDYEIALANEPPQRLSGGGGGGGGGLTAYPGGGGQGNKQVVWGFGDIGKSFKPQPLV